MQEYTEITEDTTVKDSRGLFLANDKTIASHFAGAAFPTENLIIGMECYRTDQKIKYRLTNLSPVTWEATLTPEAVVKIKVDSAVHADTATKLQTAHTINGVAFDGSTNITVTAAANGGTATNVSGGTVTAADVKSTNGRLESQGTSSNLPQILLHIPNVNYSRLRMSTDGVIHAQNGGNDNYVNMKAANFIGNLSGKATTAGTADNANKLGGLALAGARNNVANQVVRTDGSGYIQAGWINTPSGAVGSINKIYCSNDDYIRYMSVANFKTALDINNVNNTADANKNVNTAKLLRPATLAGANVADIVYHQIADNDYFRIRTGGTASNAGYVELATADDGNEPIYVRQYTGVFSTLVRTATLLDGNGNTSFPGTITASSFNGTAANANKLLNKNWYWSGQGGQPTWLWGGSDGTNMYVYNPANFRVANANTVADKQVGNAANKIPVYSAEGHLVLPSGAEIW